MLFVSRLTSHTPHKSFYREFAKTTSPGKKERLVVLGSGWGSYNVLTKIDHSKYDVTAVSPRNHFLFTPLLASTTVGTLDFRSIVEPIRKKNKPMHYYMAECIDVDHKNKEIMCQESHSDKTFSLPYDKLVIGVGASSNDFNIPGVKEYAYFLKELKHARAIRSRIVELFEKASLPTRTIEEQRALLHVVVVGAGPTGVEFAGELSDFFWRDLVKYFPEIPLQEVKITILEGSKTILSAFDSKLVSRAVTSITKAGVYIRTDSIVKEVTAHGVRLADNTFIPCGLVVWSTGIGPRPLVKKLDIAHGSHGGLAVDPQLRVPGTDGVFALGDCAEVEGMTLPATAQVARQQGSFLASKLNADQTDKSKMEEKFVFKFMGIMLYAGGQKSIFESKYFGGFGFFEWILWRSVYLLSLGSIQNRFQVPAEWLRTIFFGRDVVSFGEEDTRIHHPPLSTLSNPSQPPASPPITVETISTARPMTTSPTPPSPTSSSTPAASEGKKVEL